MTDANDVQQALDYVADLADGADRNIYRMLETLEVLAEAIEDYRNAARAIRISLCGAWTAVDGSIDKVVAAELGMGMDSQRPVDPREEA